MSKTLNILPDEAFEEAAECLRIMAHPVRLKMVSLLMQGRFAVHELAELCGTSPEPDLRAPAAPQGPRAALQSPEGPHGLLRHRLAEVAASDRLYQEDV